MALAKPSSLEIVQTLVMAALGLHIVGSIRLAHCPTYPAWWAASSCAKRPSNQVYHMICLELTIYRIRSSHILDEPSQPRRTSSSRICGYGSISLQAIFWGLTCPDTKAQYRTLAESFPGSRHSFTKAISPLSLPLTTSPRRGWSRNFLGARRWASSSGCDDWTREVRLRWRR